MWSKLLCSWLVLVGIYAHAGPRDPDPMRLQPVINGMAFDGVDTKVVWEDCGFTNAFYIHRLKTVLMCNELKGEEPGVVRYILAHELAHGVILQRDLPISWRWGEYAADELAVLVLAAIGNVEDIRAGARFWADLADKSGGAENPFANHPGHLKRAIMMLCLAEEIEDKPRLSMCGQYWDNLVATWVRLLNME